VLSKSLENHRTNDKLSKIGGRILSKLASGNVESLVARMDASTATSEKEFLAGLLANLSLEEENAEKIVAAGGLWARVVRR
jgi:hypothetical protein